MATPSSDLAGITSRLDDLLRSLRDVTEFLSNHEKTDVYGAQGTIISATYHDPESFHHNVKVALKVIRATPERRRTKYLLRELTTWSKLQPHPNILELYGFCIYEEESGNRLAIVSPYMELGALEGYLKNNRDAHRLSLVLDVARGMHYLHTMNPPIVHGDLKGDNILIRPSGQACLADFGLSRVFEAEPDEYITASLMEGNWRWMSPERIMPEDTLEKMTALTPASDVYSFAGVVYQVYSGKLPYDEIRNDFALGDAILSGQRPARPREQDEGWEVPDALWMLVEECWKEEVSARPTAECLVQSIEPLLAAGA